MPNSPTDKSIAWMPDLLDLLILPIDEWETWKSFLFDRLLCMVLRVHTHATHPQCNKPPTVERHVIDVSKRNRQPGAMPMEYTLDICSHLGSSFAGCEPNSGNRRRLNWLFIRMRHFCMELISIFRWRNMDDIWTCKKYGEFSLG